jgi:hypothetical protein
MDALPVMTIRKPTEEELDSETIPTFVLTSELPWNPSEHHHDLDLIILASTAETTTPDTVDVSDTPSTAPQDHQLFMDAQPDLLDPGEDLMESGEAFQDASDDFQDDVKDEDRL